MSINWSDGQGRVRAGGKSLEWAAFGERDPAKPVIVMLHEGLGCVALWRDFPCQLAAATQMPVFAYSRAGYGRSEAADLPRPLDYMSREAEGPLRDILDAIAADNVILVGHSDGATIAAIYGGGVEDFRVRGLVLMAPHFFTEPMGLAEIARARKAFAETDLKDRMDRYHEDAEATFRGWNDAWLDPGFESWDVSDVIDYLRVPALVIQGREDQYGTRAQVDVVKTRSYAPVDVLIIDDCRHSPFIDQTSKTLDAVAEFTTRLVRIESEGVVPA